ncbi:MAG: EAL domain-containing protein, partial [Steroidobacteraceae bacterium]|nr:EAL domain-containing protein [Steroidobacteraceae bacterium]MDW8258943.1 EAL domain-containing protein [Gammaproteobacteria bacterium]
LALVIRPLVGEPTPTVSSRSLRLKAPSLEELAKSETARLRAPAALAPPKKSPTPAPASNPAAPLPLIDLDSLAVTQPNPALPPLQPATATAAVKPASRLTADAEQPAISLYVQQLMKLRSGGRTRRYEVLVRGQGAAAKEMDADLIKALSLRDTAAAIDRAVVTELGRWLAANQKVWNSDPTSFSINLSLGSLLDPAFMRFVAERLRPSGVAPETIGFEVPEPIACKHRDEVARFMADCERLGCYVVLDDFTLHSDALSFLGSRATRVVKIDPRITAAAMKDRLSQAIVIAISQACKVLGLHCVAKRVDTTAARQWLAAVGVDFAQGYVLEDPRPIDALSHA